MCHDNEVVVRGQHLIIITESGRQGQRQGQRSHERLEVEVEAKQLERNVRNVQAVGQQPLIGCCNNVNPPHKCGTVRFTTLEVTAQ